MPLGTDDPEAIGGYRLVDRLGSGGMGVVFLARSSSGREVAVKVVHEQYATDATFRTRFRQEVAAARRVSGAFTAPVVDADAEARRPWMATLYVPGPTLAERLKDSGPLDRVELRQLALGLVEALRDIHRVEVVHRDLKPANVLLADDGPKVIDFGISRAAESQGLHLTATGHVMGTPPFMSPEQLSRPREVGPASDVFSLGTLLVYAAVGRGPFDADSPYMTAYQVVNDEPDLTGVPEDFRPVVARCLAKKPEERPELTELAVLFAGLGETQEFLALKEAGAPGAGAKGAAKGAAKNGTGGGTKGGAKGGAKEGVGGGGPRGDVTAPAGGRVRTRLRRRVRGHGVALAVTAVITLGGVTGGLLAYGGMDGDGTYVDEGGSPASPRAAAGKGTKAPLLPLPVGWKPWQTTLTAPAGNEDKKSGPEGVPLNSIGCVVEGTAAFCGGDSVTTVRIDTATGATVWRAAPPPAVDPSVSIGSSVPIGVENGVVLITEPTPDDRQRVTALDADNGKRLWTRPSSSLESEIVGVVLDGLAVTVGADDRTVTARDLRTGERRWESRLATRLSCRIQVVLAELYAFCGDAEGGPHREVVHLAKGDGRTRKTAEPAGGDAVLGSVGGRLAFPVWREGLVGEFDSSVVTGILLVDPATRAQTTVKLSAEWRGMPVLLADTLYFVRQNGTVAAVSPLTGKTLWERDTSVEQLGPPTADKVDGTLYLASASGRVVALDPKTGEPLWETGAHSDHDTVMGGLRSRVYRAGRALIVISTGGVVFTIDPNDPERAAVPPDGGTGEKPSGGSGGSSGGGESGPRAPAKAPLGA
ncbi:PQQ-binding-like beta-propeller repeat protein [Streptomyces sp. NPDC050504]|uniref:serine/threonine-protein kinase n=1 Tax=Streptomyces sp. NPDC050504 TaxID=3365618 RepID=UPI0037A95222